MLKRFCKYVLQSIAGMIGISVYILADTFFISKCSGADGLALLNLTLPIYGLMFAIGSMIGIGSATWFSIKTSCGQNSDRYFLHSIFWGVIFSIPFIIGGILCPDKVLKIMGADSSLISLGRDYLKIVLTGAPLFICNYTFTAFVRNDKAPSTAMAAALAGSSFNIAFDYIFIFPAGMGLKGAALATAISPAVTMLVCSLHLFSKSSHISLKAGRPSLKMLLSCCKLGVPAFVGEISGAITTVTFNFLLLNIAGNVGIAAYGIIANISLVVMAIFNGIAQGVQPLFSECYGKNDHKGILSLLKLSICVSLAVMASILLCIWNGTDLLISIFNSQNNMQLYQYAFEGMHLYFPGIILASVNIIFITCFAAVNKPVPAFICSVLRGVAAIIISAVLLSALFGITGIWLSFLSSEIITFIFVIILSCHSLKSLHIINCL